MIISSRQAIVLAASLAAFVGGMVGLVIVSRMPPSAPTQKKPNMEAMMRDRFERKLGRKGLAPLETTNAPPLAGNASAPNKAGNQQVGDTRANEKTAASAKRSKSDDETLAAEMLKEAKDFAANNDLAKA